MPIDKSWMNIKHRACQEYYTGIEQFLEFASRSADGLGRIRCPCARCRNQLFMKRDDVYLHILQKGMYEQYTTWYHHGETHQPVGNEHVSQAVEDEHVDDEEEWDDMEGLIMDAHGQAVLHEDEIEEPNENANKFYEGLKDAEQSLYPGCTKYTKLSFIVKMLHIKCLNGLSNKAFDMIMETFQDVLPELNVAPKNYYESKKIVKGLHLDYVKIHACKNDCILYWNEHENRQECPVCGLSRWDSEKSDSNGKSKIPWKILRYFPLTKRLQRIFMSSKTAADMRWHHEGRVNDGLLRHPADAEAWKEFDRTHPLFALEPRNVRVGIASDGFNPFGNMSTNYSIWPVVVTPYNLPPWKCMKQPYMFMSLLTPGKYGPGNNIDVYLRPLIDELKQLWDIGIETYDASVQKNFNMRVAVMWTVNDYPAYGNLSGWSTKGKLACPCCNSGTGNLWLKHFKKTCYMKHRRFLPADHKWRNQTAQFDGKKEKNAEPKRQSGDEVLNQLQGLNQIIFGKHVKNNKIDGFGDTHNWKKLSIFFELPYWRTLLLRHNLDVMHIEKNICDNVTGTVMNIKDKTKDTSATRNDLKEMGIRRELHPKQVNGRTILPPACYTLSPRENKAIYSWLKGLKVPDGYSANISRCVNESLGKISGMKTHDCHVFLERFFPLAVREFLPRSICDALIDLSTFFVEICSKVLRANELDQLEQKIILTICKLERIFPPSFFDIMVHLPIHLPWEAKVGGPVQYRWMYPIERYLRTLKSYVRNKAQPEGSIAEGYIADECLIFCSMYLKGVETRFNRPDRNYDGGQINSDGQLSVFSHTGRPYGKPKRKLLSDDEYKAARFYILQNCEEAEKFAEEHVEELEQSFANDVDPAYAEQYAHWFENHVTKLYNAGSGQVDAHMLSLARGPERRAISYKGYYINGFKFNTLKHDLHRKTQHSGLVVITNYNNIQTDFYGQVTEVVELQYTEGNRVVLFKCDWFDVRAGIAVKTDRYGFVSVNTTQKLKTNEPFVLASQATQVFYVDVIKEPRWRTVISTRLRNLFDMPVNNAESTDDEEEPYQEDELVLHTQFETSEPNNDYDEVPLNRNDVEGHVVDEDIVSDERDERDGSGDDSCDDCDSDDILLDD